MFIVKKFCCHCAGSYFWSGYVLRSPGKPYFLAGYPGIFAGKTPGAPEKFEKKESVWIFRSLFWNEVWGKGCDNTEISEEKRLVAEVGQGIQRMKALLS